MKAKMPHRYHQKRREAKREDDIALAHRLGGESRHEADPEGSQRWVETGIWKEKR